MLSCTHGLHILALTIHSKIYQKDAYFRGIQNNGDLPHEREIDWGGEKNYEE